MRQQQNIEQKQPSNHPFSLQTHLTAEELAERLRMSPGTLQNWRTKGLGPKYIKFGRRVLYPIYLIEEWENNLIRDNTAQGYSF